MIKGEAKKPAVSEHRPIKSLRLTFPFRNLFAVAGVPIASLGSRFHELPILPGGSPSIGIWQSRVQSLFDCCGFSSPNPELEYEKRDVRQGFLLKEQCDCSFRSS